MDKIHAMKAFIRVTQLQSFTKAAEEMGLPRSTLSRQLQALESALGTRLLQRTTRRVQLTQEGQIYFDRCRDVLATLEEMDQLFQHEPATLSGRLRVDMPASLASDYIIPQLPSFLQHYPGIELELNSSDRQVDVIREGFDCAIRTGTQEDSELITRSLGALAQINCASPHYIERFGTPHLLEDLTQHAMVHYGQRSTGQASGFEFFDGKNRYIIKTGGALTVNCAASYRAACLAGLGIIQAPEKGLREALTEKKLVEILPHFRAAPIAVSLQYPHCRSLSRRVQVFIEWLTQALKAYVA